MRPSDALQTYLQLVAGLCVFLCCQVIIALTHAALRYALQQLLSSLVRQIFAVGYSQFLCQLLCDGQVLGNAQLQGLMILCSPKERDTSACTHEPTVFVS